MREIIEYVCTQGRRSFHFLKNYASELRDITAVEPIKLKSYQKDALKNLLDYLYEKNSFYNGLLNQVGYNVEQEFTWDIFQRIPLFSKEMLRKKKDGLLCVPIEEILHVHTSTGTSGGESISIMYTINDLYGSDLYPQWGKLFYLNATDVVAVALPYEMSSAGQAFQRVAQIGYQAVVLPVGKGGAYSDPTKAIELMKEFKCTVLISSPSYVIELMKAAENCGFNMKEDILVEQIWLTGEGCSNKFRNRIESKWNADARFYYGSLECGALGIECGKKDGYHIPDSHVYLEIINPDTGETLEDGEIGEIVVTTLLKEGTPLVRYRTQDIGFIEHFRCECGIPLKKLYLRGRKIDQIIIDGKEYAPIYIEEMLMNIKEVGDNYFINVREDMAEVVIELASNCIYRDGLEEIISSQLEYRCGMPNQIKIVDKIPCDGKKVRRVNYINGKEESDDN
ncbi:MAG: AMP-binding protein [Lachnospiraceae bacterium]|nr:AMP-binding protein [Lachnospiraceae bacterium]